MITKRGNKAKAFSTRAEDSGTGRIVIPDNISRDVYIERCYSLGRVSIFTSGAGLIRDASVCLHCMNDIEFPNTYAEFGSRVLYMKVPAREETIVYGILKDPAISSDISEYQFSLSKYTEDGIAGIVGDADDGSLTMTVDHTKKVSRITINAGSKGSDGKVIINVTGDTVIDSDRVRISLYDSISIVIPKSDGSEITEIMYKKGEGFSYCDEFGNKVEIVKDRFLLNHKKMVIFGEDKESAVLGNTLIDLLSKLIKEISISTVPTPMGAMPLTNAVAIAGYIPKLKEVLSSYVKLK